MTAIAAPNLQELLSMCEPYGDCMLWTGGLVYEGGQPRLWVGRKPLSTRRVVYELARGEIRSGMKIVPCCGERLCLNPDHLRQKTMREIQSDHHRRVGGMSPSHKAAVTAAARRRANSKMDMERAREIRASTEPTMVLAERHGLCKSTICKIRRNDMWAETARGASIFSM